MNKIKKESDDSIATLSKELDGYKRRIAEAYDDAETEAHQKSEIYAQKLKTRIKYVFWITVVSAVCLIIYNELVIQLNVSLTVVGIGILFINLLCFIDSIKAKFNVIKKWIQKKRLQYFDEIYSKKAEELNRYFLE